MKIGTKVRIKDNVKDECELLGISYTRIHKAIASRGYGKIVRFPFRLGRKKAEKQLISSKLVYRVHNQYFTAVFPAGCLEKE